MPHKEDIAKVDRSIKEAEARLLTAKIKIDAQDKELAAMTLLKSQLEENIKNLKQTGVAAVASEYKKAKMDLAKTITKIGQIQWDKLVLQVNFDETLRMVNSAKATYDRLLGEVGKNVLHGKFPKK